MEQRINIGLPRMHKEPGERRDFLPSFISRIHRRGADILLEYGYGSEMGYRERDYLHGNPGVRFATRTEIYQQDYVLVLRCPSNEEIRLMHPGACLISMLHYPTRAQRVSFLRSIGIDAVSLDSLKDDTGRRLVENLRAVAWYGIETAFQILQKTYPEPGLDSPQRAPIYVTLLGGGAVGAHVVQAAIRYGNEEIRQQMIANHVPGVIVTTVDYDITGREAEMKGILSRTDILVDATQRLDPSQFVIPNDWISKLPRHAVLLDLSVDPYICDEHSTSVKGIEGIPQGNLDKFTFSPDDPEYDELPDCVSTKHRRHVASCYSWPGIYPQKCMEIYGKQISPIFRILIEKGGISAIDPNGNFFERAIGRAMLSRWPPEDESSQQNI
ncbi:MAG: hypothetical protein JW726_17250 [Anaerolineales bacterium]|nr:hypothetical protein [Anaerolineales bacterium]